VPDGAELVVAGGGRRITVRLARIRDNRPMAPVAWFEGSPGELADLFAGSATRPGLAVAVLGDAAMLGDS
jgi:hypothetical protein